MDNTTVPASSHSSVIETIIASIFDSLLDTQTSDEATECTTSQVQLTREELSTILFGAMSHLMISLASQLESRALTSRTDAKSETSDDSQVLVPDENQDTGECPDLIKSQKTVEPAVHVEPMGSMPGSNIGDNVRRRSTRLIKRRPVDSAKRRWWRRPLSMSSDSPSDQEPDTHSPPDGLSAAAAAAALAQDRARSKNPEPVMAKPREHRLVGATLRGPKRPKRLGKQRPQKWYTETP